MKTHKKQRETVSAASEAPRERWLGLTSDGRPARKQKPPSRKLTDEELAFIEKEMPELKSLCA